MKDQIEKKSLEKKEEKQKSSSFRYCLDIKTLLKNYDLYQYNSDEVTQFHCKFGKDYYFFRKNSRSNNVINWKEQNIDYEENGDLLFRVRKSIFHDSYEIINPIRKNMVKNYKNISNLNNLAWYVIKSEFNFYNNNEDYILNENDIIKLGIKKFEVIKKYINMDNKNKTEGKSIEKNSIYNISEINNKEGSIFNIKIPFTENKTNNSEPNLIFFTNNYDKNEIKCFHCKNNSVKEDILLFKICSCNKFFHYECFKKFLKEKLKISKNNNNNIITYKSDDFYCNECTESYPLRFKLNDKEINFNDLIDLKLPSDLDYIILESLNNEKDKTKIIYVIPIKEKIEIGKEKTNTKEIINDIIIENETSISNNHAVLKINNNGDLIIGNRSHTFGTLVLIKGNIKIHEKEINIQVGRSYISAKLEKENGKISK